MSCLKLIIGTKKKKEVYKKSSDMENKFKEEMMNESNLIIEKL